MEAYRLIKKHANPAAGLCPLKVVLESDEDCERVSSSTYRIKDEYYYIARDVSPEDRLRMKTDVEELKCCRQSEERKLKIVIFE